MNYVHKYETEYEWCLKKLNNNKKLAKQYYDKKISTVTYKKFISIFGNESLKYFQEYIERAENKEKKFIEELGEIEGKKYFKKFIQKITLENFILKYGEEKGSELYNKMIEDLTYKNKIEYYIEKFGEEEGTIKFYQKINKLRTDKESLIKQHGEEIGLQKYNSWLKTHNTKKNGFIERHGKEDGESKYEKYCLTTGVSLERQQEIHGVEEGEKRYKQWVKETRNTKSNFIKRYGQEIGIKKYNESIIKRNYTKSLKGYIERYGEELGNKKYKEYIVKTIPSNGYSRIGLEFCEMLNEQLDGRFNKVYYGENEYNFYVHTETIKLIKPDFYIKDSNPPICVEFYGKYWHRDERFFDKNLEVNKLIREKDELKIKLVKEKFGVETIIVWESDYMEDKEKVIDETLIKINNLILNENK